MVAGFFRLSWLSKVSDQISSIGSFGLGHIVHGVVHEEGSLTGFTPESTDRVKLCSSSERHGSATVFPSLG